MLRYVVIYEGGILRFEQKIAEIDEKGAREIIERLNDIVHRLGGNRLEVAEYGEYVIIMREENEKSIYFVFDRRDSRKEIEKTIKSFKL